MAVAPRPFVVGSSVGRAAVAGPSSPSRRRTSRRRSAIAWSPRRGGLVRAVARHRRRVLPLARWMLRPVADLAPASQRMAAGDSERAGPEGGGPPELRGLAAAFNAMAASVTRALARQRAFAADASHQLRNPLTALRLRLDSLAPYVRPTASGSCRGARGGRTTCRRRSTACSGSPARKRRQPR